MTTVVVSPLLDLPGACPAPEGFLDDLRRSTGFVTDVSHVALHGQCSSCSVAASV